MKKLIILVFLTLFFLVFRQSALAYDPIVLHDGSEVTPPDTATVGHVDDPAGTGPGMDVYQWTDADGTTHWVCTNGNSVENPPVSIPPEIPPIEIPPYEPPPTFNNPTIPPGPACGEACSSSLQCPFNCSVCAPNPNGGGQGQNICQAGPTATPVPVCGADCSSNPNICNNIVGCNYCNPSSKKCEAQPPTATPTPVPVCGADCSNNPNVCQNLPSCDYCSPSSKKCEPQPTATPTSTPVPTATPTPTPLPFDESMCSCDSLNFTPIVLGSPTNITAYGKVLGINKNYAKIPTFTFTFYQSPPNSAQANILKEEKVNTTVIEDTAEKVRYQAIWVLNLPSTLDTTQTYRIQAHPDCSRKSASAFFNFSTAVMGASTSQASFWDRIVGFFAGIFGGGNQPAPQVAGPTATPTLTAQQKKSLQLKTFRPVDVTTGLDAKNCTFIKFSFR